MTTTLATPAMTGKEIVDLTKKHTLFEWSAQSKSSSESEACEGNSAIPMLQLIGQPSFPPTKGSHILSSAKMRSAQWRAPSASILGKRRANSSPPSRAARPALTTAAMHRWGCWANRWASGMWTAPEDDRAQASLPFEVMTIFDITLSGRLMPMRMAKLRGSEISSVEACGGGGGMGAKGSRVDRMGTGERGTRRN